MASPVPQTVLLLTGAPMNVSTPSARIESSNYTSGMILASWSGNDAFDATLVMQGSADGTHWGMMGAALDDIGSVTLTTPDDSQQWAFPSGFPFPFIRMIYSAGSNTMGAVTVSFVGYTKAGNS